MQDGTSGGTNRKKRIIIASFSAAGYIALLAVLAAIYHREIALYVTDPEKFRAWISAFGLSGKLLYILLTVIQVVLAVIHDGPMQIAGGYAFGTEMAVALFIAGVEMGSAIAFLFARRFGRTVIGLFFAEEKYDKFLSYVKGKNLYVLALLLYLIPGTPKDMLTYCFGTTKIKLLYFLLIIGIARTPAVLLTVMIAQHIISSNILMLLSTASLLALLCFIVRIVRKNIKN
jgi:uncharacterized membrane protein YdjX (TVP38/TMEM64 family)